jgi:hypothetical protein
MLAGHGTAEHAAWQASHGMLETPMPSFLIAARLTVRSTGGVCRGSCILLLLSCRRGRTGVSTNEGHRLPRAMFKFTTYVSTTVRRLCATRHG